MSQNITPVTKSTHSSTTSQKVKKSDMIPDNLGVIAKTSMEDQVLSTHAPSSKDRERSAAEVSMKEAVRLKGVADKAIEVAKAALRKSGRESHGASKDTESKSKSHEQRKRGVSPKPAKEAASKKVRAATDAVSHVRAETRVRSEKPTTAPGSLNSG